MARHENKKEKFLKILFKVFLRFAFGVNDVASKPFAEKSMSLLQEL